MSKRHDLLNHIKSLREISEIMDSIKTLSMLEMHKIAQALTNQQTMLTSIEAIIQEFSSFYSLAYTAEKTGKHCLVLLGSERGFCGGFNESLIRELEQKLNASEPMIDGIITIGQKLSTQLIDHPKVITQLNGVSVLEETNQIIESILSTYNEIQMTQDYQSMEIGFYQHEQQEVSFVSLLPPFQSIETSSTSNAYPPILNMTEERFLSELVNQYLLVQITEALYSSTMAENQHRVRHLDSAVNRINEEVDTLDKKGRLLRQEEITEEIEVILLSTQSIKMENT